MSQLERATWNPPSMVTPHGAFSQVLKVSGVGAFLFLTDKVALTPDGQLVGESDAGAQTEHVLGLVESGLESGGAGWANVVQLTTHLVGRSSVQPFLKARDEYFARVYPNTDYPTNTLTLVDGLLREGMLVAVTAVAALGE